MLNGLLLFFTLQMDAAEGMAPPSDPTAEYSSGLDNPETHWDMPVRFLPVELHVRAGDKLTLSASHNLHDVHEIKLTGVEPRMVSKAVGHKQFLTNDVGKKLGVQLEMVSPTVPHTTRDGTPKA